ncbi:hypothetical protein ACQ5SP_16465, partial [Rhodovulum sp. YNF3179]|uniref:hypothetical protein n=1 Tax=Rhodovulum sp. YNF3179 TaxID=3425127 RepID=UPI003D32856A
MKIKKENSFLVGIGGGATIILVVPLIANAAGINAAFYYPVLSAFLLFFFVSLSFARIHLSALKLALLAYISTWGMVGVVYSGVESLSRTVLLLCSFSPLLFIKSEKIHSFLDKKKLERLYDNVIIVICAFSIYQWVANGTGLPFSSDFFEQRGRGDGWARQVSSVFSEPAFLSIFLLSFSYYNLFCRSSQRFLIDILIFAAAFLSKSLGALVFVLLIYSLRLLSYKRGGSGLRMLLVIAVFMFFVIVNADTIFYVFSRLENEVFSNFHLIGGKINIFETGSGAIRLINEINVSIYTIEKAPAFGFGPGYTEKDLERNVALNAIVEILVRYGFVGLFLFAGVLIQEKIKYPARSNIVFCIFVVCVCFVDGAIAKPYIWINLSLILAVERSTYLFERMS